MHSRCDLALEIESQPVFGAVGQGVEVAAHCPEEVLGPPEGAVFAGREQPNIDELAGIAHLVDVLADPVERVEIAQAALALLHVGLDDIAAVAQPLVALGPLAQLFTDELALGSLGHFAPEPALGF